jgi:23S rRNA-/tRNA-specific pseudouridylate synthase
VLHTLAKPAAIPVFPPHAHPDGDCLLRRLLAAEPHRAAQPWPAGFEGGLAHRLDVSTSGAVAVADDPDHLAALREAFAQRRLRKTYLFVARHPVPWDHNECDRPIAHDRRRKRRMVVQRGANTPHRGRWHEAHTTFERVGPRLWRATMSTGVMHQIRVHAAFVGLVLAGDPVYGGGPTPDIAPEGASFCLHHVGFTGAFTTAEVPPPSWAGAC